MGGLEKKTKAELISLISMLKKDLERAENAVERIEKEFQKYRAIKEGKIGYGAVRNPRA